MTRFFIIIGDLLTSSVALQNHNRVLRTNFFNYLLLDGILKDISILKRYVNLVMKRVVWHCSTQLHTLTQYRLLGFKKVLKVVRVRSPNRVLNWCLTQIRLESVGGWSEWLNLLRSWLGAYRLTKMRLLSNNHRNGFIHQLEAKLIKLLYTSLLSPYSYPEYQFTVRIPLQYSCSLCFRSTLMSYTTYPNTTTLSPWTA